MSIEEEEAQARLSLEAVISYVTKNKCCCGSPWLRTYLLFLLYACLNLLSATSAANSVREVVSSNLDLLIR